MVEPSRHVAILLAAGSSSRLGRPKQLLEIGGETLLRRAAKAALATAPARTIVALGAEIVDCRAALEGLPVDIIEVVNWADGMGTTLAAAVAAVNRLALGGSGPCPDALSPTPMESLRSRSGPTGSQAIQVLGIDQPALTAEHLSRLIETWKVAPQTPVASAYADLVGTPAVFPAEWHDRLAGLRGDRGARALLRDAQVCSVAAPELELDIDCPEDWQQIVGHVAPADGRAEPTSQSGAT